MFTRWTISNFKSIREPISLDLAPLTIFSGINSSGKSTLIQSILMVAQSFMSVVDDEALILNGRLLQLGRMRDMLHYGNHDQPMEIGFDWLPTDELITPESLVIHLDAKIKRGTRRRQQGKISNKSYPYVAESTIAFGLVRDYRQGKGRLNVLRVEALDRPKFPNLQLLPPDLRQQAEEGTFNYTLVKPSTTQLVQDSHLEQLAGIALTNIIPSRILISMDAQQVQLIEDVEWILSTLDQVLDTSRSNPKSVKDLPLSPQLSDVFRRIELPGTTIRQLEKGQRHNISEFRHILITDAPKLSRSWVLRQLTNRIFETGDMRVLRQKLAAALSEYLRDLPQNTPRKLQTTYQERLLPIEYMSPINQIQKVLAEQIHFLGPLRDDPRVIYGQPPLSEQWTIGLKGEYTAAMLDEYRNMPIEYPLPPEDNFTGHYLTRRGPLIEAVTLWLQRMGVVEKVDTEETPKVGYRLTVHTPGLDMPLDLTSVGVGVSQVLPTLVLALLADKDNVLIFEQPELHLHPKVQSVLGDFFLAISQIGKQCLVETHSEHLINRLRRRIVESEHNSVLPKLRIYFAQKKGAVSHFQQVKPNEFGSILEWPEGFFDEAENEAGIILKIQMEKRRQVREARKQQK
jgi:predicted ATPase